MICGEKTTTQQAMETELSIELESARAATAFKALETYPQMPEMASTSRLRFAVGGAMMVGGSSA